MYTITPLQVCGRVITLDEAHKFCAPGEEPRHLHNQQQIPSKISPVTAAVIPSRTTTPESSSQEINVSPHLLDLADDTTERKPSSAIASPTVAASSGGGGGSERGLNEVLRGLFAEADAEGKVRSYFYCGSC